MGDCMQRLDPASKPMHRRRWAALVCGLMTLSGLGAPAAEADSEVTNAHALELPGSVVDQVVDEEHDRVFFAAGAGDRVGITNLAGVPQGYLDGLPDAWQLALSADGQSLFVAQYDRTVVRFDADTLTEEARYVLGDHIGDMAVIGRKIWYASGVGAQGVRVYDLRTGRERRLTGDTPSSLYEAVVAVDIERRLVTVVGTFVEYPIYTWHARTAERLAYRALRRPVRNAVEGADGSMGLVRKARGGNGQVFERVDPLTLRVTDSTPLPSGTSAGFLSLRGSLLTAGAEVERALNWGPGGVQVVDVRTDEAVNRLRFREALARPGFELGATQLTSQGLLIIVLDPDNDRVFVHHWPRPRQESSVVTITIPEGMSIGESAVLRGRLTDDGRPVANAQVRVTDEAWRSEDPDLRTTWVTTDSRGRWSAPYTPRHRNEIFTVEFEGTARHPAAWEQDYQLYPTES